MSPGSQQRQTLRKLNLRRISETNLAESFRDREIIGTNFFKIAQNKFGTDQIATQQIIQKTLGSSLDQRDNRILSQLAQFFRADQSRALFPLLYV
ncbi:MAG: hypothetical protein ABJ360_13320 [Roseobacter sp.]